jgi:hypothetical protein
MYNKNVGLGALTLSALHGIKATYGKVFFVGDSSTVDLSRVRQLFGVDPDGELRYFDDLEECLNSGAVVANRGDVILVAPGHAETVSSAGAIALDIADINIIGLGNGSNRPTITFDTATTATITVSAANVSVENVIVSANFADIVSPFTLTTAKNFKLKGVDVKATATNMNFLYVVDTNATTNDAAGLTIEGCRWIEPDTATLSMVKADGDNDDVVIKNNFLSLGVNNNKASLVAIITGKSLFNAQITDNMVYRLNTDTATGGILVTTDQSDNSGIIARNFAQHADNAAEVLITASSGFGVFENRASGVAGATGYVLPAVDS